jgi:drug/metabolite transporter (DMT)-like permease
VSDGRNRAAAAASLVGVTAIWGLTFPVVKDAIEEIPPYEFLAIRFVIAALALALLFPRSVGRLRGRALVAGAAAGAALGAGYALQTIGLTFTSATRAGFITGLFVVFTPALAALMLRRRPTARALGGVLLATAGLVLLVSRRLEVSFNSGDALVLGCAVAFALHVVLLGRFAPRHDIRDLTLIQMATCAAAFALISPLTEDLVVPRSGEVVFALVLTGLGASALAFTVQTWAQTHLSPTATAVTLTMEPVFAGIAGFLLLGERLTLLGWGGAALILAAMLLADVETA